MNINNWESCKKNESQIKSVHILFIDYICQVFCQVSFLIIYYVAVLLPANRCIADRGFEYRYIAPVKPTHERAIISDNSIQPY